MMRFHRVDEVIPGPFCAPFALATVTGRPMVEFLPRDSSGKVERRGMMTPETDCHLRRLGIRFQWIVMRKHGFAHWVEGFNGAWRRASNRSPKLWQALRPGKFGLVTVTGHMLAFDGMLVRDLYMKRTTWVFDHPCARQRVGSMFVFTP